MIASLTINLKSQSSKKKHSITYFNIKSADVVMKKEMRMKLKLKMYTYIHKNYQNLSCRI